jgi:primary-amine oxidase
VVRRVSVAVVITALTVGCQRAPGPAPAGSASASATTSPSSSAAAHPLDPLTADEIRLAIRVAKSDPRFAGAAFPSVAVQDPPKADVLAWQPGQPLVREARLQAMTAETFFELLVNLTGRRLVSALERRGVEPSITLSEIEATKVVLSNAEFKGGLQKRGITDFSKVFCAPFSAGYFGSPAQNGKRLVKLAASTRGGRPPTSSAGRSSVSTRSSIS